MYRPDISHGICKLQVVRPRPVSICGIRGAASVVPERISNEQIDHMPRESKSKHDGKKCGLSGGGKSEILADMHLLRKQRLQKKRAASDCRLHCAPPHNRRMQFIPRRLLTTLSSSVRIEK